GRRPHHRRRHGGRGPAGLRARLPRHGLPGAGDRPPEAEQLKRRPTDPDRRPRGQADPGGPGMRPCAVWYGLAVLLAALSARPAAGREPLPELPDYVFVVAPREENLDVVVFGDVQPALIRFRVQIDGRGFRTAWDEFTGRLHDYLDTNSDRVLTVREAR